MRFVDEARITVRSGRGGKGSVSFLREKYRPFGGPDGGDGGRGGSVILMADPQVGTLLDFRFVKVHAAEDGHGGTGTHKNGKAGADLIVRLPVGTVVTDEATGELVCDLAAPGQEFVVAKGGRGGLGNMNFATSTNQAPRYAQPGEEPVERQLSLTLKLLADVGLVGFPNAGKSTLISRLSAAKPKIADYPFTTLSPNLGIVRTADEANFVLADIPGIIEGASEGAGLGHQFLRHIERVFAIAVLVDVSPEPSRHPLTDYETLMNELGKYSPALLEKPRVLVLTKNDLPDTDAAREELEALAEREGIPFFVISAVRGDGLKELGYALQAIVDLGRKAGYRGAPPEEVTEGGIERGALGEGDLPPIDGDLDQM